MLFPFLHLAKLQEVTLPPTAALQLSAQLRLHSIIPVTLTAEQHSLHHTARRQSSPYFPTSSPLPEPLCLQPNSLHSSDFMEKTELTGTLNRSMWRTRPMPLANTHSCITKFSEEKLRPPFSLICCSQSWHIYHIGLPQRQVRKLLVNLLQILS